MLYFYNTSTGVMATSRFSDIPANEISQGRRYFCGHDLETFAEAQELAKKLNCSENRYVAVNREKIHKMPVYDVIEIPHIGDGVSFVKSGVFTECGDIISLSKDMTITTSDGHVFTYDISGMWTNGEKIMRLGHKSSDF